MDDGTSQSSGLSLATHSFTRAEVEFLGKVLWNKYGIRTSLHRPRSYKDQYYLYIRAESMPLLADLIYPYIHPSMRRK